jgi:hypothetical protein
MDDQGVLATYRPVIGSLPPLQAAQILRDIGETDLADAIFAQLESEHRPTSYLSGLGRLGRDRMWMHTAHTFGHIAKTYGSTDAIPITHAGALGPDESLRGARINISLDRLHVADYPGGGVHHVLFDFQARHQLRGHSGQICHLSLRQRVREGEQAALLGYPLFVGLQVGGQGVAFRCYTVNIMNEDDNSLLAFLDSDVFRAGLHLGTTIQPAIGMLATMAVGLTRTLAQRHKNVPVQDFNLGLDFSRIPTRAALSEGSYVAVQIPESKQFLWDWNDWFFYPNLGQIARRDDPSAGLPYNYMVLGVGRYESD